MGRWLKTRSGDAGGRGSLSVEGLKAADLVDAMGRLHRHRCHILDLVSPTPGRVLFGPAVTISYFPSCSASLDPERYNLQNLFYEAVGDEPEGKVLVLASNGYTDASMGGGTKLSRLQNHRCAGVLTDGRLRDFDELSTYDFAAYCSGEATKWGGGEVTPFQANLPVVVSGVGVVPGQYVFADSSGAVVIPDGQSGGSDRRGPRGRGRRRRVSIGDPTGATARPRALRANRSWYPIGTDCYVRRVQNIRGRGRCGRHVAEERALPGSELACYAGSRRHTPSLTRISVRATSGSMGSSRGAGNRAHSSGVMQPHS